MGWNKVNLKPAVPATFSPEEAERLRKGGIDVSKIRTLSDLNNARRIVSVKQNQKIRSERDAMHDAAMKRVQEWGVGARVETRRHGRFYIVKFANGMVGVRVYPGTGRINFVSCEGLTLIKPSTKAVSKIIRRSVEQSPYQKYKRRQAKKRREGS